MSDKSGPLELVDWVGLSGMGDLEEGATYRLTDVKAAYDSNGTLHLQPVENTTGWALMEADRGSDQVGLDATADSAGEPRGSDAEEPSVDPDETDDTGDIRELVVQLATAKVGVDDGRGVARETLVDALSERGIDRERAAHEIDKALREGRLQESVERRYEVTAR